MDESRIQIITHKGQNILYVDFRGVDIDRVENILDMGKRVVASQPLKSVRHLTDVTGANFSKDTIRLFKEYANHNEPYIYRSAAVGVSGLMVVLFNAVVRFSGRKNLVIKASVEEAKEWLCADVVAWPPPPSPDETVSPPSP